MRSLQIRKCLVGWILIFNMIVPSLIFSVSANNQGFVWGVEESTQLDYRLTHSVANRSHTLAVLDENMYTIIRTLPIIQDDIDSVRVSLLSAIVDRYWENGSDFYYNLGYDYFYVLPVGNWPLLTELYRTLWQNLRHIYQDSTIWGMQGTEDTEYYTLTFTIQILKEDGASTYTYIKVYDKTFAITTTIEFVRDGYTKRVPPLVMLTPAEEVVLSILGLAVVIISLSVFQYQRSKELEQARCIDNQ